MNAKWKEQLEQHRSQRREDIISSAQDLLLERGLSAVTLKDIVEHCGISKVTLYKYFRSYEEIIFEVQMNVLRTWMEGIYRVAAKGGSGLEKLRSLLEHMVSHSEQNPNAIRFIAIFDAYYRDNYPTAELEQRYRSFLKGGPHPFFALLQQGVDDGSIRSDIDLNELTYTLSNIVIATLQRMILRGQLLKQDQGVEPSAILEHMVAMVLTYVKA
ncbi:TetR/AcrR family transcriptional regulator [Paenibacillus sp. J5C_2022]|uniref:TetR/AcrR family transcriptional regulator n=1 Tax=Paenibacillus sp. J5C2022 TaxID=2977129 RepID=UPI0021D3DB0C|nr:TetR/AcrR family transcriptional regulator [Paenibacillus sp. J5C2022]MCU6707760.1 TetR/AcrR family transcriptional regulator [Paenibacillus sp. J5C2022]